VRAQVSPSPGGSPLRERLGLYFRLTRLDKPIGTLLLAWPTLWALWIAGVGRPDWKVVLIFMAGTLLMRSAGCAMNDYADRDFDPHVARTKHRPLAARAISTKEALAIAGGLSLCAFLLILPLNGLTIALSFPALALAASYPFFKRFFAIPQAYLGIAFGFGIPMAFAALTETLPAIAWVLLLANVFWTVAYDTEYAMVDRADDVRIGIRTSALLFGRFDVAAVAICHAVFLLILAGCGLHIGLGPGWFAGLAVAGVMLAGQVRRIRDRDPAACFRAFLHNNRVGGTVFAGLVADALIFGSGAWNWV
jgi:4-hydroxybenzoate polyprenyltransferase